MNFKDQLVANGTQVQFNFTFKIPKTRKVNVYKTLTGVKANETADLQSPTTYSLTFTGATSESAGYITFSTAPALNSVITITPTGDVETSTVFDNSKPFDADKLNSSFNETSSTNGYQLFNYLNSSLRYNLNEQVTKLSYSSLLPPLNNKSFWRRDGTAIVAQDYPVFVEEVATDIKENITAQVNASANNANLSADIANKPFGQQYSGSVDTIDTGGNVVSTPVTPGASALSSAKSSANSAAEAKTAAGSSGGIITELFVKSAFPITKVDLNDYSTDPEEPWVNVLENSFTVYIDGVKLPEPKSYAQPPTVPSKPYTVTIKDKPTSADPSFITFSPAIAANKEILIARSEAQGNSSTMFVDSKNATFTDDSKVAARDLSNVSTIPDLLKKEMINLTYPIGSEWASLASGATPPGQGILGITWVKQTSFEGHLSVGSSTTGDWAVTPGGTRGASQVCDPMAAQNLLAHDHLLVSPELSSAGTLTNTNHISVAVPDAYNFGGRTEPPTLGLSKKTGSETPSGLGLTGLKLYGREIWKRTA